MLIATDNDSDRVENSAENFARAQASPYLRVTLAALRRRCGYVPRGGGGSVRAGVLAATAFFLFVSLLTIAPSQAQMPASTSPPPLPGFMPPYEITRIVRSAGFDPLAPPLREGTTYVLRATDFRGILMRVVVDARSGAIRAVNRIVVGPAPYGQAGMVTPPYRLVPAYPPYGVQPSYPPPDVADPGTIPDEATMAAPPAAGIHPGAHPLASSPPLPRPRPAELASRKADDAKSNAQRNARRDAKSDAGPDMMPAVKPELKAGAVSVPAAAAVAPNKPPAPPPMNE